MTSNVSLQRKPPSMRGRLLRSLAVWSLVWWAALGVAVWLVVQEEVNELLDDSLQSAAEGLIGPFVQNLGTGMTGGVTAGITAAIPDGPTSGLTGEMSTPAIAPPPPAPAASTSSLRAVPTTATIGGRFTWQLVSHRNGARLVSGARSAPQQPLHSTPTPGFSDLPRWRVYGLSAGHDGEMLYVAQTRDERREAELGIAFAVLLSGLPIALLAMVWLSTRVRRVLRPLDDLSRRLAHHDPLLPGATLGNATYAELRPVHAAIDALASRLTQRIAHERAFTAHAAHALRTPLAGIDAQLAVALREAQLPGQAPLHDRLQRVRAAAVRLQRVVAALLAMFRSGAEVQRAPIDVAALGGRLPVEGLTLDVQAVHPVHADADLLMAALLNVLDNAMRAGATRVLLSTPAPDVLQLQDDGPGVSAQHLLDLQVALEAQDYEGRMGLGLMLADLVARAHGGRLLLPAVERGFALALHLRAPPAQQTGL